MVGEESGWSLISFWEPWILPHMVSCSDHPARNVPSLCSLSKEYEGMGRRSVEQHYADFACAWDIVVPAQSCLCYCDCRVNKAVSLCGLCGKKMVGSDAPHFFFTSCGFGVCVCIGFLGKRWYQDSVWERARCWRLVMLWAMFFWESSDPSIHVSCGSYLTHHLPKHCCWPCTSLHVNVVLWRQWPLLAG